MKTEAPPPLRTHPFHLVLSVRTLLLVAVTLGMGLLGEIRPRETGARIDAHDRMLHVGRATRDAAPSRCHPPTHGGDRLEGD
jgi:hypothetical protein